MGNTQSQAAKKPSPTARSEARYVSQKEAAERWGVSVDVIRRLIASGQITGYRLNRRIIRVSVEEVDAAFRPIPTVSAGR